MFHAPASSTKQQSAGNRTELRPAHAPMRAQQQLAHLHSTYGNQAVLRMLSQSAPAIQTKLAVNQPGDVFEREADRVADQVTHMTAPPGIQRKCSSCQDEDKLQRKCAECEEEEKKTGLQRKEAGAGPQFAPPSVHSVLSSPGRPLDPAIRAFMEPRFGHDFSAVRVHTDASAADSAKAVNALAYASGQHVVFGSNRYSPGTSEGKRLLAHELAHVVQQGTPADDRRIYRQPAPEICSKPTGVEGYDSIRNPNYTRERLRARGYVFCGPDLSMDPKGTGTWERWVHPTKGLLHLKVKFEDKCPEEDFCLGQSKDLESCFQCCEKAVGSKDEDESCRKTCDFACTHKYIPPGAE